MADRVRDAIAAANGQGRAALLIYLPAGFPDPTTSVRCLIAAAEAGADVLEIGFPFSDPIMDGPTIQAATQSVLDAGITVDDDLEVAREVASSVDVPAVVMTYFTIPAARGLASFADDVAEAGLAGAILPDLPVDEAGEWVDEARRRGLATIFLASSTSTEARLGAIGEVASGFVYATSILGVTGVRDTVGDASPLVERVRAHTDLPVAVGIGVSDRDQAAAVAGYADGVIVGSAVVRAVSAGDPVSAPERVADLVQQLRAGAEQGYREPAR